MAVLIEWVTQIIIFLLLASVVDLLIPSKSMKKYVKLTVGLILILIFLKPVFYVFDMDVKQTLERSFMQLEEEQEQVTETENLLKKQKNEIQDSQHAYILEEMAVQLKKTANKSLEQKYEQKAADIDLQMSQKTNLTYENLNDHLEQVDVTLQKAQDEEGVEAVEDIVIDSEGNRVSDKDEAAIDLQGIKKLLHNVWDIDKEKITIIGEGGSS
ncbi:stage III sporulation protein AF [Barrientosiimonas marina]|uniref:Stage III sporulation protein AF n=1 Tax=Lentibacillus kimchii TaxID=1542911 RepID=A0ABW2V0I0_9BACI